MPSICIGTSITENYIKKASPFLKSLARQENNFCVCYGFNPSKIKNEFPRVNFFYLERKYPEIRGMIQWGTWLNGIPHNDEDIYIISDADVIIQRHLNEAEINRFYNYDDNTIGAAINASSDDCLGFEARRIKLKRGFPYNPNVIVVNCGVMVGKSIIFKKLTQAVDMIIPYFDKYSNDRCRCQFLICYVVNLLGIKLDLLDGDFHSHGHFGLPKDCSLAKITPDSGVYRKLLYKDKLVMFNHGIKTQLSDIHINGINSKVWSIANHIDFFDKI